MMRPRLRVRLHGDGARPEFAGARACMGDGGGPVHARRLGSVAIQLSGSNDLDTVFFPIDRGWFHELIVAETWGGR